MFKYIIIFEKVKYEFMEIILFQIETGVANTG